jgi:hypothetical protein
MGPGLPIGPGCPNSQTGSVAARLGHQVNALLARQGLSTFPSEEAGQWPHRSVPTRMEGRHPVGKGGEVEVLAGKQLPSRP